MIVKVKYIFRTKTYKDIISINVQEYKNNTVLNIIGRLGTLSIPLDSLTHWNAYYEKGDFNGE